MHVKVLMLRVGYPQSDQWHGFHVDAWEVFVGRGVGDGGDQPDQFP